MIIINMSYCVFLATVSPFNFAAFNVSVFVTVLYFCDLSKKQFSGSGVSNYKMTLNEHNFLQNRDILMLQRRKYNS